ncbi:MAG: DUF3105 domain-containing protein, partial [Actinomycetota bacterium]|nr:DUF3105 domain-containing protein [Actinomycetota bacterium]
DTAAPSASAGSAPTTAPATTTTSTTRPAIEGVQTFAVEAGHTLGPVAYAQVPPVGGAHHPLTMPCTYYDQPVPNERAVHSLEHGAVWITYRPDVAPADIDVLAALARSRRDVLVSPWPEGLPSPVVASAWGRQLQLQSVGDPRLPEFVRAYAGHGPENVPC